MLRRRVSRASYILAMCPFYLFGRLRSLKFFGELCADILANSAPFFTPICVPVWSVSSPLATFAAALFATTGVLLAIGYFTVHRVCLSGFRVQSMKDREMVRCGCRW